MKDEKWMRDVIALEIDGEDIWATKWSEEETIKFYEKFMGEGWDLKNGIDDTRECDLEKETVYWKLDESGEWTDEITLKEAIKRNGDFKEPYILSATNY